MATKQRMELLRDVYFPGYAFPEWSINMFLRNDNLGKKVMIYYDRDDSIDSVSQVATIREPVNIAMRRFYDVNKMKKYFGWKYGFYGDYYEKHKHQKLAPNIAIYCHTPIDNDKRRMVHIINSIGLAFDDRRQPDYDFFIKNQENVEMIGEYYLDKIFPKIYQCAIDHDLDTVVMSYVGANNFARLYENKDEEWYGINDFKKNVWNKAFLEFFMRNIVMLTDKRIRTFFMGSNPRDLDELNEYFSQHITFTPFEDIGYFPQNASKVVQNRTLFVNAWDCWSLAGNGNEMDNSLDGFMGRHTAIAVLTSPITNPYLNKKNKKAYRPM